MAISDHLPSGIEFTVVRSRRRTLALIVHADNRLEVRCGQRTSLRDIERFIKEKQSWIERKHHENRSLIPIEPGTGTELSQLRQSTRHHVERIVAQHPDLVPQKISIRLQKRRWGSCSRRGSIAINVCAGRLPMHLLEYIVVHELCHLKQFNHSARFYDLVRQKLPDAPERQRQLKQYLLV